MKLPEGGERWICIDGDVRFLVRPFSPLVQQIVIGATRQLLEGMKPRMSAIVAANPCVPMSSIVYGIYVVALAHTVIVAWDGVKDEAGLPIDLSTAALDRFICAPATNGTAFTEVFLRGCDAQAVCEQFAAVRELGVDYGG